MYADEYVPGYWNKVLFLLSSSSSLSDNKSALLALLAKKH